MVWPGIGRRGAGGENWWLGVGTKSQRGPLRGAWAPGFRRMGGEGRGRGAWGGRGNHRATRRGRGIPASVPRPRRRAPTSWPQLQVGGARRATPSLPHPRRKVPRRRLAADLPGGPARRYVGRGARRFAPRQPRPRIGHPDRHPILTACCGGGGCGRRPARACALPTQPPTNRRGLACGPRAGGPPACTTHRGAQGNPVCHSPLPPPPHRDSPHRGSGRGLWQTGFPGGHHHPCPHAAAADHPMMGRRASAAEATAGASCGPPTGCVAAARRARRGARPRLGAAACGTLPAGGVREGLGREDVDSRRPTAVIPFRSYQ